MRTITFNKRLKDVLFGLVVGALLVIDVTFARSIEVDKPGVSVFVFLVVGAFIVLIQAIPAWILLTGYKRGE